MIFREYGDIPTDTNQKIAMLKQYEAECAGLGGTVGVSLFPACVAANALRATVGMYGPEAATPSASPGGPAATSWLDRATQVFDTVVKAGGSVTGAGGAPAGGPSYNVSEPFFTTPAGIAVGLGAAGLLTFVLVKKMKKRKSGAALSGYSRRRRRRSRGRR